MGQHRPPNCGAGQAQSWAEGGLAQSRLGMAHCVSHTHSQLPEHQVLLFVPCCKCWPADLQLSSQAVLRTDPDAN